MTVHARYALRTLAGPWSGLVVLGVDLGIATMRQSPFVGEGMWTVRWMALGLWILWPVIAAVSAVDAARLTRPGTRHLPLTTRHGRAEYVWAAAWTAVPAAAVHAVVIAVGLGLGGVAAPRVGWGAIILAVVAQCSTFVWFAAAGSFLGRMVSPLLAGILAAGLALALSYLLTDVGAAAPGFHVLGDQGASVSQIGVTWNLTHLVVQILVLLLTAGLLVVARPVQRSSYLTPGVAWVTAALVTASVLYVAPRAVAGEPLESAPQPPDDCSGSEPIVCIFPEHRRYADPTLTQVDALVDVAREAGYESLVPARLEESSRRYDAADGRGTMSLPILEPGPMDLGALVQRLVMPAWCDALSADTPPPDSYFASLESLVFTWTSLAGDPYNPMDNDLSVLGADDVQRIMSAWSACDLSATP